MISNRFQRTARTCVIFFLILTVTDLALAQVVVNNDSLQIPAAVRVDRDGRQPVAEVDRSFFLDELAADSVKDVFEAPPCLEGAYYAGFQLLYDLGDFNTTQHWQCDIELSLLH